jgi:hypothetical protein
MSNLPHPKPSEGQLALLRLVGERDGDLDAIGSALGALRGLARQIHPAAG